MQISELVRLVLALMVLPALFTFYRRLRPTPGLRELMCATGAIFASYVFALLDPVVYQSFFNMLQHLMYGVAGVLSLIGAVRLRGFVVEDGARR